MKKILLGTHNIAKIRELTHGLKPLISKGIKIVTLGDLNINEEPKETGSTIEENSLLKAKFYAKRSKLPTIADDGGIFIDALNGEPGIKSNRWLGKKATDEELINYTLERMKNIPNDKRSARMSLALTFYDPLTNKSLTTTASIEGCIAKETTSNWTAGFPFRALFIVNKFNKYYDELSEKEHNQINHRLDSINQLIESMKKNNIFL